MFNSPFSFEGRIRRTEYCLSLLIYAIIMSIVNVGIKEAPALFLLYIPGLWFLWAQGAKRCHDLGNNGFYQLIPFYPFWLMFADGQPMINEYGVNPKAINIQSGSNSTSSGTINNGTDGYVGGYDGGHNSTNSENILNTENKGSEYKDGDLYR
jgi:uncharacterized membrane protein YhaH (DUF805 family)